MNLSKLFEMQRQLDEKIEREHPHQPDEDRLGKKVLALLVEIEELANELPEVFKFWSNKKNNSKKALEEFCDALHFTLSIGLDILDDLEIYPEPIAYDDIIEQFNRTFEAVSYFYTVFKREHETQELVDEYTSILSLIFGLGKMLGFTWEQIEEAYMRKNAVNHHRQVNGY